MKWQSEQDCCDRGEETHDGKLLEHFGAFEDGAGSGRGDAAQLGRVQRGKKGRQGANRGGSLPPDLDALGEFGGLCVSASNGRWHAAADIEYAAGGALGIGPGDEDALHGTESRGAGSELDGGDLLSKQGE